MSEINLPTPETFSLLDALQGRSYPTDKVTLFTDIAGVYELASLRSDREEIAEQTPEHESEVTERIEEVRARVLASALEFRLRGFAPKTRYALVKSTKEKFEIGENDEIEDGSKASEWLSQQIVIESVYEVVDASGRVDSRHLTQESLEAIEDVLPPSEYVKLIATAQFLSYSSMSFDAVVGPDFS